IIVKDNKLAGQNNIEDFLNGDVFSSSRNLSTEIGIIQSRAVLLQAASELHLNVSCFGYGTFSRIPLYKNVPFRVVVSFVHPGIYDVPFSVKFKDDTTFELKLDVHTKNLDDYSYRGNHHIGEKISTPYFSLTL